MKAVYLSRCTECAGCVAGEACPNIEVDVARVELKLVDGSETVFHDVYDMRFRNGMLICCGYNWFGQKMELNKINKIEVIL